MIIIICWSLSSPTTEVDLQKNPNYRSKVSPSLKKITPIHVEGQFAELLAPDAAQCWQMFPEQCAALHISQRLPAASDLCPVISPQQGTVCPLSTVPPPGGSETFPTSLRPEERSTCTFAPVKPGRSAKRAACWCRRRAAAHHDWNIKTLI